MNSHIIHQSLSLSYITVQADGVTPVKTKLNVTISSTDPSLAPIMPPPSVRRDVSNFVHFANNNLNIFVAQCSDYAPRAAFDCFVFS